LKSETTDETYHPNRLRVMYIANIFVAGGLGLAFIISPSAIASLFGATAEVSMWAAGYAYSFMVAIAFFALLGLRSPLKFSMILLVQAATKIIWIFAVFVPALLSGSTPSWTIMLLVLFVLWATGDLVVTPWHHFVQQ
jgi:hypothetical protein